MNGERAADHYILSLWLQRTHRNEHLGSSIFGSPIVFAVVISWAKVHCFLLPYLSLCWENGFPFLFLLDFLFLLAVRGN